MHLIRMILRETLSVIAILMLAALFVVLVILPNFIDGQRYANAAEELPAIDQVLERYITAVGGRDAIERLSTRVCTGRQIDDRPYRGPAVIAPLEAWATYPDRWLLSVSLPDAGHREGADGERSWRETANGVVRDDVLDRSRLAWLLDPRGPLRMQEYFPGMRVTGTEVVSNRRAYGVETDRDAAYFSLYFDAETGLLLRIGYYWELSDYRQVDGVRLPFRVDMSRKGGVTSWVFDEVRHDVATDEERFDVPPATDSRGG